MIYIIIYTTKIVFFTEMTFTFAPIEGAEESNSWKHTILE